MYARYGDFITQSSTAEGLWFENGTLQSEKVKMLSRSYAKVQFYIISWKFMMAVHCISLCLVLVETGHTKNPPKTHVQYWVCLCCTGCEWSLCQPDLWPWNWWLQCDVHSRRHGWFPTDCDLRRWEILLPRWLNRQVRHSYILSLICKGAWEKGAILWLKCEN